MKKLLLLILFMAPPAFASGSKYSFKDPLLNDEFDQVYHDMNNILSGTVRVSSVTISTLTVTTTLDMGGKKITRLGNGTAATDAATFGQIKVIQSTCTTSLTSFSTTQNTFQATNNTATITPTSASNRILVLGNSKCRNNAASNSMFVTALRAGTNILGAAGQTQLDTAGGTIEAPCSVIHMDAPNTASSTVYAIGVRNSDSATTVSYGDTNMTQEMCLFEVAYP